MYEPTSNGYPQNPALVRVRRGEWVESQHRGAWVLVDASGAVLDGAGAWQEPVFARSAVKSFQALPLFESGAAERWGLSDEELVLALASHNAEARHTDVVAGFLERQGLSVQHLQCGPQVPRDPEARRALRAAGGEPSPLHNNCSGKHAGFLALAGHVGTPHERYLDPESEAQRLVRGALAEMCDLDAEGLPTAVDGCSAPTFRVPLSALATGFARLANPSGLSPERRAHCRRMTAAVARFPELVAGHHARLCTDLARVTGGRLFPKIGAEAVYGIGVVGSDRGLAVKVDDGSLRGLGPLVVGLLERLGFLSEPEAEALSTWRSRRLLNWAGRDVGRIELCL